MYIRSPDSLYGGSSPSIVGDKLLDELVVTAWNRGGMSSTATGQMDSPGKVLASECYR